MTLRSYLIMMIAATSLCWAAFVFVIWTVNPFITNRLGFFLFYLSLFLALAGSAAIIGFLIRFIVLKRELAFRAVKIAFRQSFLFSFLIVATLFLLAKDLFSWLNLLFLIIGLSILEYFLISYGPGRRRHITPDEGMDNFNNT